MSKSRALKNREDKKKQAEYHYGRGGRQTTTDPRIASQGKITPATYMPSGSSGSLKVQSMQKKKEKQAYDNAFNNRKLNRVR